MEDLSNLLMIGTTLCLIYVSFRSLTDIEYAWRWHERWARWSGLKPERTDAWETKNTIGGCIGIVLGIFILGLTLSWNLL